MPRFSLKTCAVAVGLGALAASSVALASAPSPAVTVHPGQVSAEAVLLRLENAQVLRKNGKYAATLSASSVAEVQLSDLSQPAYVRCDADVLAASSLTIEEYVHSGSKYLLTQTETISPVTKTIEFLVDPDPSGDYAYRISANDTWELHSCTVEKL